MQSQMTYKVEKGPCLYLVPTPIGNLEDMTLRALRILGEVDLILAEDTRQTKKLLQHYEIDTNLESFHDHSNQNRVVSLIDQLQKGQRLALVSDAGMPLINDPGHPLVQACLQADIPVTSLPGPNAALTGLVASGLTASRFTYYGFFPRNKGDQVDLLEDLGRRQETGIFYESPYRIKHLVHQVGRVLGPDCRLVLARELTKLYEHYLRGSQVELADYLDQHTLKGEFVVVIEGGSLGTNILAADQTLPYKEHVELLMAQEGMTAKEAIKQVARIQKVKKQDVYQAYHEIEK